MLLFPDDAGTERLASWTGTAGSAGDYRFYARWPAANDNASDARYTIAHAGGSSSVTRNQQANGGQWNLLGAYALNAGQAWRVELSDQAHGNVIADAVYVVRDDAAPETFTWTIPALDAGTIPAGSYAVYARWAASSVNSSSAAYTVTHAGGASAVSVNQKQNGGQWRLLGAYSFAPGAGHGVSLAASADGRVVADAIRLVAASGPPADIVYIHPDQLGAPQKMTDAGRAVVWDRQAGPFGELETIAGLAAMPLRFPGQYADAESSFNYNYFRDYDPTLGRYIESDPIGLMGGLNTYAYVGGNPLIYADPTGEFLFLLPLIPIATGAALGFGTDIAIQLLLNGGEWDCIDWWSTGISAGLGAAGGGLGALVGRQGLTSISKGLSNSTKGRIGEWLSIVTNLAKGSRLVRTQARIHGLRTVADSAWVSLRGSRYYVESKFGTGGLTAAQRAAQRALGDAYRVERWTYPWIGNVGTYAGAAAGGIAAGAGVGAALGARCDCD